MKKIFLVLFGISILLIGVIFVLYNNYYAKDEEVIDIFKDNDEQEETQDSILDIDEKKEDDIEKVVVDIKGMILNPGVYEVSSSSRVNDVIELAGGLIDGADTSLINLAKIVFDEMTIIIYSNDEVLEKYKDEICVCECPLISNDACTSSDSSNSASGLVNINTAGMDELMKVSGIGEAKADSIIRYREENGRFKTIEDIMNVSGIGESLFEKIKNYITV